MDSSIYSERKKTDITTINDKQQDVQQQMMQQQTMQQLRQIPQGEKGIVGSEYDIYRRKEELEQQEANSPFLFKLRYRERRELKELREHHKQDILNDTVADMQNELEVQLKGQDETDMTQVEQAFQTCMEKKAGTDVFQPDNLLAKGVEQTGEVKALCEILKKLRETSAADFTQEEAHTLIQQYQNLNLKTGEANTAHYLKMKDEQNEAVGMKVIGQNPGMAYLLLYQCASVALRNYLNQVDKSQVNLQAFSTLCGIAMTATYAASIVCVNNPVENYIEETREEKLREIIKYNRYKKPWFQGYYEPLLKNVMGRVLEIGQGEDSVNILGNEVIKRMERLVHRLDKELGVIEAYVSEHEELTLGMPRLKEKICAKLGQKLDMNSLSNKVLQELEGKEAESDITEEVFEQLIQDVDVRPYQARKTMLEERLPELKQPDMKSFWEDNTIQSWILYAKEEDFTAYVKEVELQVQENEKNLRKMLERNLMKTSREIAFSDFKKQLGVYWYTSSSAVIAYEARQMLAHLGIFSVEANARNEAMKNAMKNSGFPEGFAEQAQTLLMKQNVDMKDAKKLTDALNQYKQYAEKNAALFGKKVGTMRFSEAGWKALSALESEYLCIESEEFEKLLNEKIEEVKEVGDTEKISWNEYFYSEKKTEVSSEYLPYKKRLEGADLCEWSGFGTIYSSHKELVMREIAKLLKGKKLAEHLKYMEGIDNFDMLEHLTAAQYQNLCVYLRANLGKTAEKWAEISGVAEMKLRSILMEKMILGEVTEQNFDIVLQEEWKNEQKQKQVSERRLLYLLGSEEEDTTPLHCNILKVEDKAQRKVQNRLDHFRRARGAWELLNAQNLYEISAIKELCIRMLRYYREMEKNEVTKKNCLQGKSLRDWMWDTLITEETSARDNLNNEALIPVFEAKCNKVYGVEKRRNLLRASLTMRTALGKMQKTDTAGNKEGRRYYFLEFLMCGMEKELFGPGKKYEAVLNGGDEAAYENTIASLVDCTLQRSCEVEELFKERPKEERVRLMNRLSSVLGGLEPTEQNVLDKEKVLPKDMKEQLDRLKPTEQNAPDKKDALTEDIKGQNLEKYGVESFDDLWDKLESYVSDGKSIFEDGEIKKTAEVGKIRKEELENYDNQAFRGLVPFLMKEQDVWKHMMFDENEEFQAYMGELCQELEPLIKVINRGQYRYDISTVTLFLRENQAEIRKKHDSLYWQESMNTFTQMLLDMKTDGKTLEERLKKADAKYGDELTMRILSAVLKGNKYANEILKGDRTLEMVLSDGKKRYDVNRDYMDKRIAQMRQNMDAREADKIFLPFIQYMIERCITNSAADFQTQYDRWYADYRRLMEEHPVVETERVVLDEIQKTRIAAANQRTVGIELEQPVREQLQKLRTQAHRQCSPILAVGDRKNAVTGIDIDKAERAIDKKWSDIPKPVRNILVEKYLSQENPKLESLDKEVSWLTTRYQQLMEAKPFKDGENRMQLERYFMYLYLHDYKEEAVPQGDALKLYKELQERQEIVKRVADMEQMEQYAFIKQEIADVKNCLTIGLYTMSGTAFQELAENRMQYFASVYQANRVISEEIANRKSQLSGNKEQIRAGFLEYFRTDILAGITKGNLQKFQQKVQKCMENDKLCDAVQDFDTVLGAVSSDDLSAEERQGAAVTRKDLEKLIGDSNQEFLKEYNQLDDKQRQLFALTLMIPGQFLASEQLAGAKLVLKDMGEDANAVQNLKEQIQHYIRNEAFKPEIQYGMVVERLSRGSGIVNEDVFKKVMTFTKLCITQYRNNRPKNWNRLNGGAGFLNEELMLIQDEKQNRRKELVKQEIDSPQEWLEVLRKLAAEDGQEDMKQVLEKLDADRCKRLVVLLQKRTILDEPMKPEKFNNFHDYVDWKGRAELLEQLKGEDRQKLLKEGGSHASCTQAFLSLCSFQLRDDVDMTGRFLQKDDFVKAAMERKTLIDWQLFRNALKTEEELVRYQTRIAAIRKATEPELIAKTKNKKAIDVYKKYEQKPSLTQEEFDEFLQKQAEEDMKNQEQVAALMAGYYALDENQKSLFLRALEHRDVLDVSKEDFVASYFGRAERDYVNPQERDRLANEYLKNASSHKNRMKLDNAEKKAVMSLLSHQIDDSMGFEEDGFRLDESHLSNYFRRGRETAVDWKLFARALQFVNRTSTEAQILAEDYELYVSRGDLKEGGVFKFESEYLRKNLHTAGNRATHFFGRMAVDIASQNLRSYGILQDIITSISDEAAEKAYKYGFTEEEEAQEKPSVMSVLMSANETVNEKAETVGEKLEDEETKEYIEKFIDKNKVEGIQGVVEKAGTVTGLVNTAGEVIKSVADFAKVMKNLKELNESDAKAKEAAEEDAKEKEIAAASQSSSQEALSASGEMRNRRAMESAKYQTYQNQYRQAITDVKDVAKNLAEQFGGESVEVYTELADKAVECAFFIHQYFTDRKVVENYLELGNAENPKLIKLRTAYEASGLQKKQPEGLNKYSNRELLQTALGFESFDELSQSVGFEIIRSLLYSAGPYNTIRKNRIQSIMILSVLGFQDMVGRQDSEAALAIYRKLGGAKYK